MSYHNVANTLKIETKDVNKNSIRKYILGFREKIENVFYL